jgi:hypothetical protein
MENSRNPDAVLQGMVSYYRSFSAYSDTGHVTSTILKTRVVQRRSFSTLYQAPSFFRFEFANPHPHPPLADIITQHVVGFDGTEGYLLTKKHGDLHAHKSVSSIALAVAGAAGISSGSAHTIGRLLLPEVAGLSFMDLVNPRHEGETDIDGIPCWSITAELPTGGKRTVWIEKNTLLLRKIVDLRETFRAEEMRQNICVNGPVEINRFAG